MSGDVLASHKRMRASLLAIMDLDPPSVTARVAEMDAEIARLSALLGISELGSEGPRLEIVSIAPAKAA